MAFMAAEGTGVTADTEGRRRPAGPRDACDSVLVHHQPGDLPRSPGKRSKQAFERLHSALTSARDDERSAAPRRNYARIGAANGGWRVEHYVVKFLEHVLQKS